MFICKQVVAFGLGKNSGQRQDVDKILGDNLAKLIRETSKDILRLATAFLGLVVRSNHCHSAVNNKDIPARRGAILNLDST
jgi:hypothetical protein